MADAFSLPSVIPLEPAAAPVDTYVRPPQVGRSNLEDLAVGLQHLDSGLRDFMVQRQATAATEDAIKGQAAFYRSNKQGFDEAVSSGAIPAQASPHFIAGYKRAQGSVAGYELQQKFMAAYDGWDGKNSEDPQAFTKFATGFISTQLGQQQDPAILKGLLPHVNAVMAEGLAKYTADRHKIIYQGSIEAHAAEASQAIDAANRDGLATGQGIDYAGLNQKILAIRADEIANGTNPMDADKKLIEVVTTNALSKRDPKLLSFLDEKVPGKDYTFGSTPEGGLAKLQAIHHLEVMGRQALHDEHSLQVEADKKAKAAVTVAAIEAINKNPAAPLDDALLVQGEKFDPEFRVHVLEWQKHLSEGAVAGDPKQILQVHQDILKGTGIQAIQDGLANGALKNPADLDKAFQLWKAVDAGGDRAQGILKAPQAATIHAAIQGRTPIKGDLNGKLAGLGGMSDEGMQATTDFDTMLIQWSSAHPNATALETNEFVTKAGKQVLDGLASKEPEFGTLNPYTRTPEATQTLQNTGGAPASRPKQPIAGPDTATLQQWFTTTLTDQQRAAVQADAQAKGVPVEQRIRSLYNDFQQKQQPAAPNSNAAPASTPSVTSPSVSPGSGSSSAPIGGAADLGAGGDASTASAAGAAPQDEHLTARVQQVIDDTLATPPKYSNPQLALQDIQKAIADAHKATAPPTGKGPMATPELLKNNPAAASLADFIAAKESFGNYNAVIGNARSTQDLSSMTLSEVYALQRQLVNSGRPSTAVGRYQFLQGTLKTLAGGLGINATTTKFTPELQDRLFVELLKGRGYEKWQNGDLSDEEFASNLSKEWASLPDPFKGGKSHYDGDKAGNHAGRTMEQVYGLLNTVAQKLGLSGPTNG